MMQRLRFGWSKWIVIQIIAGIVVLAASTIYTSYLTEQLKQGEYNKVKALKQAYEELAKSSDPNVDITFESYFLEENKTIPLILVDEGDNIVYATNFGEEQDTNFTYLERQLEKIRDAGLEPFTVNTSIGGFEQNLRIYYQYSQTLRLLTWFPLFQLLLIAAFVGLGYYGLSAANRAEKNRIWAGLAKETAHQLGTPISAIIAWQEILKSNLREDDANRQIIDEMNKDIDRLNLIADRFSKIGSRPVLEKRDLHEIVRNAVDYMKRRASRKVNFIYPDNEAGRYWVDVNPPLFEWVVENLLRNALDAMEGKGNIILDLQRNGRHIHLDISDTGKGIPQSRFNRIFEPGYSTKKRGWGLGLSLARRIIENYHHGKIYVKESRPNAGSTFTIQLPVSNSGN